MTKKPDMTGAPKRLLSYEDLMHYLSLSRGSCYKLVAAGEFPAIKIGVRTLFDLRDVDAWVERKKKAS